MSNILDANIWTYLYMDPDPDQNDFSDVYFDTHYRLLKYFPMAADGAYDEYENRFDSFNARVALEPSKDNRIGLEYRFSRDKDDQISPYFVVSPNDRIMLSADWRYNFQLTELEEQEYGVHWKSRCLNYGIGVRDVKDDGWQGWFAIGLNAMPSSSVTLGKKPERTLL